MTSPGTSRDIILGRLSADADAGMTAREISDATDVKYSTVTEVLRSLGEEGLARKEKSGRQVTWIRVPADEAQQPAGRRDASATGAVVVDEQPEASGPVPVREDPEPSETAVDASDALTPTDVPADPGTAVTGDVVATDGPTAAVTVEPVDLAQASSITDVAAFMEQQRPIPDAPAAPEKKGRAPRTRSAGAVREVRNDFGSGGLQGEVIRYMDDNRAEDGSFREFGPYELSVALKAHASSVAYSLKRTTAKGQTVQTNAAGEKPRFRLKSQEEADAENGA